MTEDRSQDGFDYEDIPNEESAIDAVLGDNPRASELQQLITALQQRRNSVLREADKSVSASERIKLEAKIAEMDMQLRVLREEAAITTFVEDSVRATIRKPLSTLQGDENYDE